MPLNTAIVGGESQAFSHRVDSRWLMAYAAALGDMNAAYLDTAAGSVIAHPVFPVCLEWPAILDCARLPGSESASAEERARGVHASHDLHLYRPIIAGETLTTRATVIGLESIRPGAAQTTRLDTRTESGELVARTYQLGISRDVGVTGEPALLEAPPALPLFHGEGEILRLSIAVPAGLAHTYTECARIWNPIHTDRAIALAAGLPDIILHGTASLALAVSAIVHARLGDNPQRVRRLGGRFKAMVLMPSTLTLIVHHDRDGEISFTLLNAQGDPAISQGFVCYE
jgi:acyl dehydratase